MKKLLTLLAIAMFMVSGSIVNAQTVQTHTKMSTSKKVVHTKKDATPDRRYKENKSTTKSTATATHVKANGTPDMRYKENKKTTTTTKKSKM